MKDEYLVFGAGVTAGVLFMLTAKVQSMLDLLLYILGTILLSVVPMIMFRFIKKEVTHESESN